jgi:hypothetical protein
MVERERDLQRAPATLGWILKHKQKFSRCLRGRGKGVSTMGLVCTVAQSRNNTVVWGTLEQPVTAGSCREGEEGSDMSLKVSG